MKLGVTITAFNEKNLIPIIQQYEGIADRIVVGVSKKSWFGDLKADNGAEQAVRQTSAFIIQKDWRREEDQRNELMGILRDMDYVITSHCDTFFLKEDLKKLKGMNLVNQNYTCNVYTYWKDYETVIYPHISLPTLIVKGDSVFSKLINIHNQEANPEILPINCYHLSWTNPEQVKLKIMSYSHAEEINQMWYNRVYIRFKDDMLDFAPTNPRDFHTISKDFPLPLEIRKCLKF